MNLQCKDARQSVFGCVCLDVVQGEGGVYFFEDYRYGQAGKAGRGWKRAKERKDEKAAPMVQETTDPEFCWFTTGGVDSETTTPACLGEIVLSGGRAWRNCWEWGWGGLGGVGGGL